MNEKKAARGMLHGRWIHSHEEDTDAEFVYRPSTFSFPPARGRDGFEFRDDDSCTEIGIGSEDRPEEYNCSWEVDETGSIFIYDKHGSSPTRVLKIVSVGSDRLVIKR